MPRLTVLRGPASALRARSELAPGPEDLVLTPSYELPWEGVRRLVAALAARHDPAVLPGALAPHRAAASLVLRGLARDLDAAEGERRAALAAQAPGFLAHNSYVSYPLRIAFVRALAPLLAGRRVVVLGAEALDRHSAAVLVRLAVEQPALSLVLALDPARLPEGALWRSDALTVLALLQHEAASEIGALVDVDAEPTPSDMTSAPCPFIPSPWDDDLDARALAALSAEPVDVPLVLAALEAAWNCYGFHACLRLGLGLLARGPELAPAARRRVHLLVALAAYNRQVSTKGESAAADDELARLLDEHLRAALAGEDDPLARSHILYRLAINLGRRRGNLPEALALADDAVAAAEQTGLPSAPFFAAWALNGRAYVRGRLGDLAGATADVARADALAQRPVAGPLASEQLMTQIVLADNLAALHTWASSPLEALRWQELHRQRAALLDAPAVPSPRWLELYSALGDLAAAVRVAEEGLRTAEALLSPADADLFAAWLGELRYRQGDAAAARRAFERAGVLTGRLRADHRDAATRVASALAAMRSGDLAPAEAELSAILEEHPAPELCALAGVVAALHGDRERATARVNKAIAGAVEGGERDELLRVAVAAGEACLALGDVDEARAAFAQALELAADPPAQPADLLAAVAGAAAAGNVDTSLIDHVLTLIDPALADAEAWWQLDRLARAWLDTHSAADPTVLRDRLAQRVDADPALLAALVRSA